MMKLFYKIWVELILFQKIKLSNKGKWKVVSFIYMALLVGINIGTIEGIIKAFAGYDIFKPVEQLFSFFRTKYFKSFGVGMLMMFIPASIINYILIFHNNRYEQLILKYENKESKKMKLLKIYFFTSIVLFIGINLIIKLFHLIH